MVEITAAKQNIEKSEKKKNEDSLRDILDNIKCTSSHIIGVLRRRRERERIWENI